MTIGLRFALSLGLIVLSTLAGIYVRLITAVPIADPTGGYRCYRREILTAIDLDAIVSNECAH